MQASTSLRGGSIRAPSAPAPQRCSRSTSVVVEANRKVQKKTKVILTKDFPGVGETGEIKLVPLGYWRNFLAPSNRAVLASEGVLMGIQKAKENEVRQALEVKAKAKAFANALATIGKFTIRKKVGERDQIYGSVQTSEVAEAIFQQTGRNMADTEITLPEIKTLGTYECTVKLHPEVTGTFSVVVVREKNTVTVKSTEGKAKKKK